MNLWARIVRRDLGVDLNRIPGGGAAGGLGAALIGLLGGRRRRGADAVLEAAGFWKKIRGCSAVVTGEGRVDATTFQGKAVGEILRRSPVPVFLIAGSAAAVRPFAALDRIARGRREAMRRPREALRVAARRLAAHLAAEFGRST
jgi:glycerate kinase